MQISQVLETMYRKSPAQSKNNDHLSHCAAFNRKFLQPNTVDQIFNDFDSDQKLNFDPMGHYFWK
jgi:hypothetical protein